MPLTIEEAVALTGKSKQTLWRWKRAGVQIDDETELKKHSEQMDLSATGATHSRAIERLSSASPVQAQAVVHAELDELPEAGQPGAVQALTRLQALEVQFERRVQASLKTNNQKLIAAARADHGAVAESMRRYEVEIKQSERDLGSLIPRDE